MVDIVDRLKKACVGRPAKIPWPHYILHEAVDEIGDLRDSLRLIRSLLKEEKGVATSTLSAICDDGLTSKDGTPV